MYKLLTLRNMDEYFLVKSNRNEIGVFFYRIIGYDKDYLKYLKKFQTLAQNKGNYIKENLTNPSIVDVDYLCNIIKKDFTIKEDIIKINIEQWLKFLSVEQIKLLTDSIYTTLKEMQKSGMNDNIIRNAYIKFMYWLKYKFENSLKYIGKEEFPKILYECEISKYELYMLRILSLAGCDIIYVNFISDYSYQKYDANSKYSHKLEKSIKAMPPVHFTKIDLQELEIKEKAFKQLENINLKVNCNKWDIKEFIETVFLDNNARVKNSVNTVNTMYIKYLGVDKIDEYSNRIFSLKQQLEKNKKKLVFIENGIDNPTIDEINQVKFQYNSKEDILFKTLSKINFSNNLDLNTLIKKEFLNAIEKYNEPNLAKQYNLVLKLLCWLKKYSYKLFLDYNKNIIPIVIYFGKCDKFQASFLNLLSKFPVDIIYINPNKSDILEFENVFILAESKNIELSENKENLKFPNKEIRIRANTVAYSAERELDTILYNDTGMYRNRQFQFCKPITLKTTYEEINILWKEEAKYRPNFEIKDNLVTVPNIFAKVCGIKDNNENDYIKNIQNLIDINTMIIKKIPFTRIETINYNYSKQQIREFIVNQEIDINKIKNAKEYKYAFLNENKQNYILEKIQELISLKLIIAQDGSLINEKILTVLLNLDKQILRLIQQFDFTKQIPKLIITDFDEGIFSLEDCIILLFLNLVGFDIIIFTPTGYQNLEKYIDSSLYEEYQIGDYNYNLKVPNLKVPSKSKTKTNRSLLGELLNKIK